MRTYGRAYNKSDNTYTWVEVNTDANGFNDAVYVTTLIQCLKLNLGESPFNANYGIPAQQSVVTQLFPDMYVMQTQQQFAPHFASIVIAKVQNMLAPYYNVNILTHLGSTITRQIPV